MATGWLKQSLTEPLFPEVLWNQPVNKRAAGRLLIVGGHASRFSLTQGSYAAALRAGVGEVRVALPDSIRKLTGQLPDCVFLPSTPAGSLARETQADILVMAGDVDGVLLAGEFSGNSETTILLEHLLGQLTSPLMLSGEIIDSLLLTPQVLLGPRRVLVASHLEFSKLAKTLKIPIFLQRPDLQKEIRLLVALGEQHAGVMILCSGQHILVHCQGRTSVTQVNNQETAKIYGTCAAWWLQHSDKFEALTTAAYQLASSPPDH